MLEADRRPVADAQSLQRLLFAEAIGRPLPMTVYRSGAMVDVITAPGGADRGLSGRPPVGGQPFPDRSFARQRSTMHGDRRIAAVLLAVLYTVSGVLCLVAAVWPMRPDSPVAVLGVLGASARPVVSRCGPSPAGVLVGPARRGVLASASWPAGVAVGDGGRRREPRTRR